MTDGRRKLQPCMVFYFLENKVIKTKILIMAEDRSIIRIARKYQKLLHQKVMMDPSLYTEMEVRHQKELT